MKSRRSFNTSGPNIPEMHYTLGRKNLILKGLELVDNMRYFTIRAPRQTGKSTYFRLLAAELEKDGYRVCHINFENYKAATELELFKSLKLYFQKFFTLELLAETFVEFSNEVYSFKNQKFVFICDEIEGLNPEIFNQFLHTIRNLYHSRSDHSLKSVILVGVSNINGIIQDNASPFNIADELDVPYFTDEETIELLGQHEKETGQKFDEKVKQKISEITANQPGLVNSFARRLVEDHPDKKIIELEDYLRVEEWYLTEAIDKNVSNIINKASKYRSFVEGLLFTELTVPFAIDRPSIKELFVYGIIKKGKDGNVEFWVPLYKKRLFSAFFPYTNGEGKRIAGNMFSSEYLTSDNKINFNKLIDSYRDHIRLRSFRPFREKDENGNYLSIPEAAMIYSFETYISIFLRELDAKVYREAFVSLGNTDLIINVHGFEYLLEIKKYYSPSYFVKGKKQLAYYCNRAGLNTGYYIVFIENTINPNYVSDLTEIIDGVEIITFLIWYDEEKDF
ncbi:MAG TPA: hypothetical protein PKK94_10375 [Leptospiraceae bacterium]|nr:hypothetical protein [Leptospiraceae bacterium]